MATERMALAQHLRSCLVCDQLLPTRADHGRCPCCAARVHARKPDSLNRTWALLVAAYVLLLPANLLPVMRTETFAAIQQDTILSGVLYLWHSGAWPLSLVVFVASIVVPLGKLAVLTGLAISVQRRSRWQPLTRTRLYRLIEFVGRWSMLDIFVVTLLAALVRLQAIATIEPGPGALAFAAVVVLTMAATHAFDPRLIWDHARQ